MIRPAPARIDTLWASMGDSFRADVMRMAQAGMIVMNVAPL